MKSGQLSIDGKAYKEFVVDILTEILDGESFARRIAGKFSDIFGFDPDMNENEESDWLKQRKATYLVQRVVENVFSMHGLEFDLMDYDFEHDFYRNLEELDKKEIRKRAEKLYDWILKEVAAEKDEMDDGK